MSCINKALRVMQFLSDASDLLIAPSVLDVLSKFLPEFQQRESLLMKLAEYLEYLKLYEKVNERVKVRHDVYEVTASEFMRGRVDGLDEALPTDEQWKIAHSPKRY